MKYNVQLEGLDCADCALHLEQDIQSLPGIKWVKVHFINKNLQFELIDGESSFQDVRRIVEKSGYSIVKRDSVQQTTFIVEGMDCADEARPIEEELKQMSGIEEISFNLVSSKLIVQQI